MKNANRQVTAYERQDISSTLKVTAWQRFLSAFTQDNPYTSEDDTLRSNAQARISPWQGEQQRVARLEADRQRREAEARRQAEVRRRNREAEERRLADSRRRREAEARRQAAIRRDTGSRTWREPIPGMQFVKVPGGSFQMGCHANAGQCDGDEKPVRTVRLDGFWLGKHEVTVGQFRRFVNDSGYRTEAEKSKGCWIYDGKWKQKPGTSWRNPGFQQGGNHPVACVTWNDTQAFARWLSGKSGETFRLPSEAEWEYSCRAGGKPIQFGTGNGQVSSSNAIYKQTNGGTTPVGKYQANSLGLHDMSGNLWEWTADKYTKDYGKIGTNNPVYSGSGGFRVNRGGSWSNDSRYLRCSNRGSRAPSDRYGRLGFRLRRSL